MTHHIVQEELKSKKSIVTDDALVVFRWEDWVRLVALFDKTPDVTLTEVIREVEKMKGEEYASSNARQTCT